MLSSGHVETLRKICSKFRIEIVPDGCKVKFVSRYPCKETIEKYLPEWEITRTDEIAEDMEHRPDTMKFTYNVWARPGWTIE